MIMIPVGLIAVAVLIGIVVEVLDIFTTIFEERSNV